MMDLKKFCTIILMILIIHSSLCKKRKKFPRDNTVLILNDENFNKTISHFKKVLVEFTANWCGPYCENFSQDITKASIQLYKMKPRLHVGRIYLNDNKEIEKRFDIRRYPTLKYFNNGVAEDFTGTQNILGIIQWMLKKNSPPLVELFTLSDISNFKNTHETAVIYFGNDTNHKSYLEELSKKDPDNFFAFCDFETAYTRFNAKKGMIVLFKEYGEERTELYGKISLNGIKSFLDKYSKNKILTLTDNTIKYVWEDKHPALIFFSDKTNKNYESYERMLRGVANAVYGKILIINSGIFENNEVHLLPIMSVDKAKLPAVRIIDTRDEMKRKIYELEGIVTESSIIKFVNDWEKGKVKVMLKSETIPNESEQSEQNGVFKVVSKSFEKEVLKYEKNVFVYFHSIHNTKSKEILPEVEKLANEINKDFETKEIIRIAKFDTYSNELEDFKMEEYPKIILYKKKEENDVTKEEIKFMETDKNYDVFAKFINANLNTTLIYKFEKGNNDTDKNETNQITEDL